MSPKTQSTNVDPHEQEIREFLRWGLALDYNLIGNWNNVERWMDYGDRIRRLEFDRNGTVHFYPSFEVVGSNYSIGRYRTISDTLFIYFTDASYLEKYYYKIDDNNLSFASIGDTETKPFSFVVYRAWGWVRENN